MELKSETKYQKATKNFELLIVMGKLYKNEIEIFRNIYGYDNYSVSTYGNVRNDKTNRILKPRLKKDGYYDINLYNNNTMKTVTIHRLVALAFISNPNNKGCVDHRDNNKLNNNVNNLRFATQQENTHNASIRSNNTSGTKGINFDKKSQKWRAQIFHNKKIHIGYFDDIDDAKQARQDKARELFGEFVNKCEQ